MKYSLFKTCFSCPYHDYQTVTWDTLHECKRTFRTATTAKKLYNDCSLKDFPETVNEYLKIKHNKE